MRKRKQDLPKSQPAGAADVTPLRPILVDKPPMAWEIVFKCQRHPMLRSQLAACLMAGTQIHAEAVPVAALADCVLLASAAREHCEAEVVDSYTGLVDRMAGVFDREDYSAKISDSQFLSKVSTACWNRASTPFVCEDQQVVVRLVAWYLAQPAPPAYFGDGGEAC